MAFSISFRFKASFKGVRACICFLESTWWHLSFYPPKVYHNPDNGVNSFFLYLLPHQIPPPRRLTPKVWPISKIAWPAWPTSPTSWSYRQLPRSILFILCSTTFCSLLTTVDSFYCVRLQFWSRLQEVFTFFPFFAWLRGAVHYGFSEKIGITTFGQHFPKHNLPWLSVNDLMRSSEPPQIQNFVKISLKTNREQIKC